MNKEETILYEVHDNLYINLTNKCPCSCTFCLRQTRDHMEKSGSLWLNHEPDIKEIIEAIDNTDMKKYGEIVFCGFGEPTERLDVLLETAEYIKNNYGKKIRINTNGLSNLVNNKPTEKLFEGKVDTVSISLNTPDKEKFYQLTRSKFGICSFDELLKFAENISKYVKNVVLTTVDTTLTKEEEEKCKEICDRLNVSYRIRPWED